MAGSAAEAPTSPDIRASDAERDAAVGELQEHFVAGRLSHDTFLHRIGAAIDARRQAELPPLLADLPARRGPGGLLRGGLLPGGLLPGGLLSAGWAGSLRERVRGALPGRAGPADRSAAQPAAPPRPTVGFPAAPGSRPGAAVLAFPRGAATTFSIGRDRDCDLSVDDMTVSRVHARLDRTADGWVLVDLGSTNGTRVNGWLVRDRVEVRAGDLVRFGETEYALGDADGA
jgi:FHA domain/Domain of unknown function (DUF1707)